ncbi:MAG: hypothetical protein R3B35_13630 [Gemmatimonadales bacterium]
MSGHGWRRPGSDQLARRSSSRRRESGNSRSVVTLPSGPGDGRAGATGPRRTLEGADPLPGVSTNPGSAATGVAAGHRATAPLLGEGVAELAQLYHAPPCAGSGGAGGCHLADLLEFAERDAEIVEQHLRQPDGDPSRSRAPSPAACIARAAAMKAVQGVPARDPEPARHRKLLLERDLRGGAKMPEMVGVLDPGAELAAGRDAVARSARP